MYNEEILSGFKRTRGVTLSVSTFVAHAQCVCCDEQGTSVSVIKTYPRLVVDAEMFEQSVESIQHAEGCALTPDTNTPKGGNDE